MKSQLNQAPFLWKCMEVSQQLEILQDELSLLVDPLSRSVSFSFLYSVICMSKPEVFSIAQERLEALREENRLADVGLERNINELLWKMASSSLSTRDRDAADDTEAGARMGRRTLTSWARCRECVNIAHILFLRFTLLSEEGKYSPRR
jgi:hypothetical protein